jgi:predicted signal transduction protein with EAL and GGDEF domain
MENSINEVLERADAALYQAKRSGRDRVIIAAENLHAMPSEQTGADQERRVS